LKDDGKCECGGEQDADHLFVCPQLPNKCRKEDFLTHKISDKAIQIAAYWEANMKTNNQYDKKKKKKKRGLLFVSLFY